MTNNKKYKIIFLPPSRWKELRSLRLDSLEEEPLSFGASVEEESESPKNKFADHLKAKHTLFVEVDHNLVGFVGFKRGERKRTKHVAEIGPLYVRRGFRKRGFGSALLSEVIALAKKEHIEKLRLEVSESSKAAIATYKKFGFKKAGKLKKEFKINGKYYDILAFEKFI